MTRKALHLRRQLGVPGEMSPGAATKGVQHHEGVQSWEGKDRGKTLKDSKASALPGAAEEAGHEVRGAGQDPALVQEDASEEHGAGGSA